MKYWHNARYDNNYLWTNYNCINALKKCDEILYILREKGDESKPSIEGGEGTGARPTTFDNLTQKTYHLQGFLMKEEGIVVSFNHHPAWSSYFKMAVPYFDKAIQINPENTDMWMIKLEHFNKWLELKKEEDGEEHPELWVEIIKCCDKILSIDKDHLGAWHWKSNATAQLKRWEDELECENNVLRLDDQQEIQINTLLAKSFCLYKLGRLAESKKCCLEVQRLDPYNEMALERLHTLENQIPDNTGIEKNPASSQEASASCEKCGSALKPTAKFCGKCGTPIAYNAQI
jgi:tetratricopeptide (TPR) repeat protein